MNEEKAVRPFGMRDKLGVTLGVLLYRAVPRHVFVGILHIGIEG